MSSRRWVWVAAVHVAVVLATVAEPLAPNQARAQDAPNADAVPTSDDAAIERARVAAEAGRFVEARDLLRSALATDPRASVAFNLALVLESGGELVAARTVYDQLLGGDYGPLPEDRRARAAERRTMLSGEIATLRVRITGVPRATVSVDDSPRGEARASGPALRVDVDPGVHTVESASRAATDVADATTVEVTLDRGEVRSVTLDLTPRTPASSARPADGPDGVDRADGGPSTDGVIWAWIGAGVAVVAAGVVLGVVLASQNQTTSEPPLPDNYLGQTSALRF